MRSSATALRRRVTPSLAATKARVRRELGRGSASVRGNVIVGLFRKVASVSSLGAVDFRSDKERTARKTAKGARYAKVAAKEAQEQTRIMQAEAEARRLRDSQSEFVGRQAVAPVNQQPAARSLPERLAELAALCEQGVITPAERDARREELLREV